MISFTQGNLLEAKTEAVVNTVNTVGVMGKGIALMFKERFPENFKAYAKACKDEQVRTGEMFVTSVNELTGPQWIVNFPTKRHWKARTQIEWIESGLDALRALILEKGLASIAIPPLGCGNGGLSWAQVRPLIEKALGDLDDVKVIVYEPTAKYQNVAKKQGVEELTPARALIAEMVRRYSILGFECSILEIQKIAWFLQRVIDHQALENPLKLKFEANRYGPYSNNLTHLLDSLDGSYLKSDKRLSDAAPSDSIRFVDEKAELVWAYLASQEANQYEAAVEETDALIDGFQSPLGLEALATVDWLLFNEEAEPKLESVRNAMNSWAGGADAARRKQRVFTDRLLEASIEQLKLLKA